MKPTIREIARELKLSPATVSKALSGRREVNDQTRARVVEYANKHGYTPTASRSQAAISRIAIMIQDTEHRDIVNASFYDILLGFKQYAKQRNLEVVMLTISEDEQEDCPYDEYIRTKQIDGVFIMGLKTTNPYYSQLLTTMVHSVALDIVCGNEIVGAVGVDNITGVRLGIKHLTELGHKKIGFVNGHMEAYVSQERLSGYMAAMCGCGLSYDPDMVFIGDFTESSGARGAEYFAKHGVSAIFCASDMMAIGVVRRLNELGINVPQDISVVGFDNAPLSEICFPKLTTIAQDRFRIGLTAAAVLDGLMHGIPINNSVLAPKLIIRESTSMYAPRPC